ncbi:hypothetical protein TNCV_339741 [Trichonephila clavipes]|nr:hypothetical protein TNCV_4244191 [Trichonephila clavipes]GFU24905.1 hypothetical protein TNCV_339741 [Trichonephila clavipes]
MLIWSPEIQPIVSCAVKILNWPNNFQTPSILAVPTCKGNDETMEVRENQMAGDETDGENGIATGEDQNDMTGDETGGENDVGLENLFQLVNESAFKSYFQNE